MKDHLFDKLPLSKHLGLIAKLYMGVLSKRLEHLDADRYCSILVLLDAYPEGITQQSIADFYKVDKASMVRIIDCLADRKLIERRPNPNDRREHRVVLTAQAVKMMPQVYQTISEINKECFAGLPKEEIKVFKKVLSVLETNLKTLPANDVQVCVNEIKK